MIGVIVSKMAEITAKPASTFQPETRLIGSQGVLQSRELVELLVALEEYLEDNHGVRFDWTSDSAMSAAVGAYRSVRSLAAHIAAE